MRPSREQLRNLPRQLSRVRTREALMETWREIARVIYSPQTLHRLPPFATKIAGTFWDVDPHLVVRAAQHGDPAFFVAYQLRLDQLDCAAVALGRSLAERSPIIRAKWILDGFRQAAEEALIKNGGTWPPSAAPSTVEAASEGHGDR